MTQTNQLRFRRLYDKLVQPLYRYIYFKCGDQDLAQDVVQDVFLNVWSKMDSIDDSTASAYCYTAAKNVLINKLEKQASQIKYKQQSITLDIGPHSPQEELLEKEFRAYVSDIINRLPEPQREVFLLHRIEHMKYSDIATSLQISQKAVEKRMSLALKYLREEVEKYQSR